LLLAAGVTVALAAPAGAETSDTGVFGYWTTFPGAASDGKPVCGMHADWASATLVVSTPQVMPFFVPNWEKSPIGAD